MLFCSLSITISEPGSHKVDTVTKEFRGLEGARTKLTIRIDFLSCATPYYQDSGNRVKVRASREQMIIPPKMSSRHGASPIRDLKRSCSR